MSHDQDALLYHAKPIPGKVDVQSSKSCSTEEDLSLAYSPGVAAPCIEIHKDPSKVFEYTTKGNLVAVITNGSAVLGLGNIGPLASKPVMEGKGVLFKEFAGINVFDIELDASDVDSFVATCKALEPTFGGINLEDIKAPECFEIEKRLKKELTIPVFHDDQHGTAIISGAALINACIITERKLKDIKIVVNGAGAAALSCSELFISLGVKRKNIIICDSKGVIYQGRKAGMNKYKEKFAVDTSLRTLEEALVDADCFIGLSVAGALSPKMIKPMKDKPIIFAMANPDPEISPALAKKHRPDAIIATGRTDYPNQVNNVLGFPSIFRGALDTCATNINEEMKLAAVHSLAKLAQQEVPETVSAAYGGQLFTFGPDYIIPKPFDPRVIQHVAPAVAKAAMDSGVAKKPIKNFKKYKEKLEAMQGEKVSLIRDVINRVRSQTKLWGLPKIVIPEGDSLKTLKACNRALEEKVLSPQLLGNETKVKNIIEEHNLESLKKHIEKVPIINPEKSESFDDYANSLVEKRQRKGVMRKEAERVLADPNYFAAMSVERGDADGMITGGEIKFAEAVKPILSIIGTGNSNTASGLNIVLINGKMLFFTDTAVNINPTAKQLAFISVHAAKVAKYFKQTPKIAMLSYSNFTGKHESPKKMKEAVKIMNKYFPEYATDGEMQADTAVNPEILNEIFGFNNIKDGANILVFPNLDAGNISYKLVQQLGGGEVIGPFLMGVKKPANVVQRTGSTDDIFNTMVLTALECQAFKEFQTKTKQKKMEKRNRSKTTNH